MKFRFAFAAAVAASVLASCSKTVDEEMPQQEEETVRLNVNVAYGHTKATGTPLDDKITSLQVFTFGTGDLFDGYASVKNTNEVSLDIPKGAKLIHALVNAPEMTDCSTYADFKARISDLKHNNPNAMVMEGWGSQNVKNDFTITIPVKRFASRITLVSVKNDMGYEYLKNTTFKLIRAYLINVPGDMEFTGAFKEEDKRPAPKVWYNKKAYTEADNVGQVTLSNMSETVVPYGETYSVPHYLYSYANPTEQDAVGSTWSPRRTRLVVEAKIGDRLYYYPVTLPILKQNTEYRVNLTVTQPGSSDPDTPYTEYSASATIEVVEWADGDDISATI